VWGKRKEINDINRVIIIGTMILNRVLKITSYKIEGEYWFPILTCKQLNKNIEVKFVNNEEEIINYVNKLKEE